jgi:FMN phosphatase YigB (HAD superfamily)
MTQKLILTDADGVLLDWEPAFHDWMLDQGHSDDIDKTRYKIGHRYGITNEQGYQQVVEFNKSERIRRLEAYRDSLYYVQLLHRHHGYKFTVITSIGIDPKSVEYRCENLNAIFGKEVFKDIVCLDTGADKDHALAPYAGAGLYWIEDKEANAVVGSELGLKSILLNHPHNQYRTHHGFYESVDDWSQIYKLVVSQPSP